MATTFVYDPTASQFQDEMHEVYRGWAVTVTSTGINLAPRNDRQRDADRQVQRLALEAGLTEFECNVLRCEVWSAISALDLPVPMACRTSNSRWDRVSCAGREGSARSASCSASLGLMYLSPAMTRRIASTSVLGADSLLM